MSALREGGGEFYVFPGDTSRKRRQNLVKGVKSQGKVPGSLSAIIANWELRHTRTYSAPFPHDVVGSCGASPRPTSIQTVRGVNWFRFSWDPLQYMSSRSSALVGRFEETTGNSLDLLRWLAYPHDHKGMECLALCGHWHAPTIDSLCLEW
ncbi:hypothetical protein BGW80DRAFT_1288028 [Lactifluus volemus]|nr:hypothetical protein BGW80DRAFT_1288028 [Lactifluus volemus]